MVHSPSWSTSTGAVLHLLVCDCPVGVEARSKVAEPSTSQRLLWTEELDKRLTFGNTISAANLADFRTKGAGQFHRAARLQS